MSLRFRSLVAVLLALVAPIGLAACGDDDDTLPPADGGGTDLGAETDLGADFDGGAPRVDAGGLPTTSPGYVPGAPIAATEGDWTWVDFPNAKCQDGSPTGIGVNPSPSGSDQLVIYLEGGGACFNDLTCATVANPDGFDEGNFAGGPSGGIFSRSDTANPFHDWNMVYVPYCSGDIFAGNNPIPQTLNFVPKVFVGYLNMGEFLNRIVPTFPDATKVVLTGSSAGGFGAAYNYDRAQAAFGDVPVHLLNDSGPIMSPTYLTACLQNTLRDTWNLNATLPPTCTECLTRDTGLSAALPHVIARHPDRRFALLSANRDNVIRFFMGFGLSPDCSTAENFTGADYTAGLLELRDDTLRDAANFRAWYINSSEHTWLNRTASYPAPGAPPTPMREFIQDFIDGDPSWSNVGP